MDTDLFMKIAQKDGSEPKNNTIGYNHRPTDSRNTQEMKDNDIFRWKQRHGDADELWTRGTVQAASLK